MAQISLESPSAQTYLPQDEPGKDLNLFFILSFCGAHNVRRNSRAE